MRILNLTLLYFTIVENLIPHSVDKGIFSLHAFYLLYLNVLKFSCILFYPIYWQAMQIITAAKTKRCLFPGRFLKSGGTQWRGNFIHFPYPENKMGLLEGTLACDDFTTVMQIAKSLFIIQNAHSLLFGCISVPLESSTFHPKNKFRENEDIYSWALPDWVHVGRRLIKETI